MLQSSFISPTNWKIRKSIKSTIPKVVFESVGNFSHCVQNRPSIRQIHSCEANFIDRHAQLMKKQIDKYRKQGPVVHNSVGGRGLILKDLMSYKDMSHDHYVTLILIGSNHLEGKINLV